MGSKFCGKVTKPGLYALKKPGFVIFFTQQCEKYNKTWKHRIDFSFKKYLL
jgi:hypothetical protein